MDELTIQLIIGIAAGGISTALIMFFYYKSRGGIDEVEARALVREKDRLEAELRYMSDKEADLDKEMLSVREMASRERAEVLRLTKELAQRETEYSALKSKLEEQKAEITQLQDHFRIQFRNLANEILDEKSTRFAEQNKASLGEILAPLKERILEFERKVERANKDSIDRSAALREQIAGLRELNEQITREAENLTRALKGDAKARGNWGELVLERILERSGLEKGSEYEVQESLVAEDGRRMQPDIVVRLPEGKSIIIDSKVSLVAYERYVNAEEEPNRSRQLREHLSSVRAHIKGLAEKNYQQLHGGDGLDFVLMFMPVEAAFSLAVQHDDRLFADAYDLNIVIVSPSTLLATLRTIASIWRQEKQTRYAVEIAEQGGRLYDKFKDFTDSLIKVGEGLDGTKRVYDIAMKRLVEGKDNLIRKTERLRELGARASKSIDEELLKRSLDD